MSGTSRSGDDGDEDDGDNDDDEVSLVYHYDSAHYESNISTR